MNKLKVTLLLFVFAFFACQEERPLTPQKGSIQFSISGENTNTGGRVAESDEPHAIVITIRDGNGGLVENSKKMELFSFPGGGYATEELQLPTGNYQITSFLVVDAENDVLFLTPMKDSEKANLVDGPLPVGFSVGSEEHKKITLQVIEVNEDPASYGYVSFDFDVIHQAISLRVKPEVMIGDVLYESIDDATLSISGIDDRNNATKFTYQLQSGENSIEISGPFSRFRFELSKWGKNLSLEKTRAELLEMVSSHETLVLRIEAKPKKILEAIYYDLVANLADEFVPIIKKEFTYNADGTLDKILNYSYDVPSARFVLTDRYFKFFYEQGRVVKYRDFLGERSQDIQYEYATDGRTSRIVFPTDFNSGVGITYDIDYATDKLINIYLRFTNGRDSHDELAMDNGNTAAFKIFQFSGSDFCTEGKYGYDRQINPFRHLGYFHFDLNEFSQLNKNNRTSEDVQYLRCFFPSWSPVRHEYEYTADGYPVSKITVYNGGGRQAFSKATYRYQE